MNLKIEIRDLSYRMSDRNTAAVKVRTVNFISVPSSTPDNPEGVHIMRLVS